MASFKATILKKDVKEGDKPSKAYNVKIRVIHERKVSYISTPYNVKRGTLTKDLELKERGIVDVTNDIIDDYAKSVIKLGKRIHTLSAKELADYLVKVNQVIEIDFADFSQDYINKLVKQGKTGNAGQLQAALNNLKAFMKSDRIPIIEINSKLLEKFETFLTSERVSTRTFSTGKVSEKILSPMTAGLFDTMRRIRQLFLAAVDEYNDSETGEIKIFHNPFKKYKIKKPPVAEKRNLEAEVIKAIRDVKLDGLPEFSRDVFMLSFYLVGINTVDLYNVSEFKRGRLNYKRTKTKTRRQDEARISIKLEPEAKELFDKYSDPDKKKVFNFYKRYKSYRVFNQAVNVGLKTVAAKLIEQGIDITPGLEFYYARGSWSTIAKKCRISTDDIGFSLNHVIPEHETTNLYIETDFTIIDEANRKVIDVISDTPKAQDSQI